MKHGWKIRDAKWSDWRRARSARASRRNSLPLSVLLSVHFIVCRANSTRLRLRQIQEMGHAEARSKKMNGSVSPRLRASAPPRENLLLFVLRHLTVELIRVDGQRTCLIFWLRLRRPGFDPCFIRGLIFLFSNSNAAPVLHARSKAFRIAK